MTTLGQRLAHYRKEKGFTQQQLGELINVSPQAISKWENDQAEPDVSMLITLASLFEISLNALLKGEDDVKQEDAPAETQESDQKASNGRFKKFLAAHKKPLIVTVCIVLALAIMIPAFFIIASRTFLQPCSMYNYNRINVGMSVEKVEEMLGLPHKASITKTVDGYSYDASNAFEDAFMEGLLGSLAPDAEVVVDGTYYYYADEYGRISAKIVKLEDKIFNADIDTDIAKLEQWEEELATLEESLRETERTGTLQITFKNEKVTYVRISTEDGKFSKP